MLVKIGRPVVYRGTITGLRISSVNGTAFIDNAWATIPTYADGNHLIEIYDSSNRQLTGYLKAAGSAETLDSELVVNGDFASDVGWTQGTSGWLIGAGILTATNGQGPVYRAGDDLGTLLGALYRLNMDVVVTSGATGFGLRYIKDLSDIDSSGNKTGYLTGNGVASTIAIRSNGFTGTVDNASVKKVLTPSTSGCTIVNSKGGTTYNFKSKDASFTYNAASYFCVIRKIR